MTNTQQNNSANFTGLIIGVVFSAVISSVLIWVVGKLGLGLEVEGFDAAFIAGTAIAVVGGVITWLFSLLKLKMGSGILLTIFNIFLGAIVLFISDQFITGLKVNGFLGALVASIAIGVISWLLSIIPRRMNKAAASEKTNERMQ